MEENTFWYRLWILVATVLVVLILSITTYNLVSHSNRLEAISGSPTPVAVACALESDTSTVSPTCVIALSKGSM